MSDMWERFERGLRRSVLRHSITPRALLYQGLLLVALVLLVWEIASNVVANSERIGTALGFGFLGEISGFEISFRLVPYILSVSTYFTVFLVGLLNTALVAFIGIILASILGLAVGLLRLSSNWLLSQLAFFYVESIRGVPLLLQIMFWHFAVFLSAPSMQESLSFGDAVFVNLAGIFVPQPVTEPGFAVIPVIFFPIGSRLVHRASPGKKTPDSNGSAQVDLAVRIGCYHSAAHHSVFRHGQACILDLPGNGPLPIARWHCGANRVFLAAIRTIHLYLILYRRDRSRRCRRCSLRSDRGRTIAGP